MKMMMLNIGELYLVRIAYDDNSNKSKIRPVLVINKDDLTNSCTIVEITGTAPKNPPTYYDQFKKPITRWREAGLDKPSYVKIHKTHNIKINNLHEKIGFIDTSDFYNIIFAIHNYQKNIRNLTTYSKPY